MHYLVRFLITLFLLTGFLSGCLNTSKGPGSTELTQTGSDKLVACELGTTRNPHRIGDMILAGQPNEADLLVAAGMGVRTVLSLRHPDEISGWDQEKAVTAAGMKFIRIPFKQVDELTDSVFDETRQQLRTAPRPILVHCASANRVGAIWLPYRVLDEKVAYEQALAEAREIGLKSSEYQLRAEDYLKNHQ